MAGIFGLHPGNLTPLRKLILSHHRVKMAVRSPVSKLSLYYGDFVGKLLGAPDSQILVSGLTFVLDVR